MRTDSVSLGDTAMDAIKKESWVSTLSLTSRFPSCYFFTRSGIILTLNIISNLLDNFILRVFDGSRNKALP